MKKITSILAAIALVATLPACTPVTAAVGAGATVGVAAAQEGGIRGAVTDRTVHLKITELWLRDSVDMYRRLTLTVKEGRVLIAGPVQYPDMRVRAVQLAWQVAGVKQIINEIKVDNDGGGVVNYVTDTWITGNIKGRMLLDKFVQSINYNIDTVDGTVYIMGVAQDQAELTRVLEAARNTKYVKNVVSYARMRGEMPAGVQSPTVGNAQSYQNTMPQVTDTSSGYNSYAPSSGSDGSYLPPPQSPMNNPAPVQAESLGPPR